MELKFKRLSDKAIMPIRAHEGDAGVDLTCTDITQEINECGQLILVYHTDIAVEIPEGYVGMLFPRSSAYKKSLIFANAVGVIDSGYRGEIMAKMRSTTDVVPAIYKPGERFAQLVIVPLLQYVITEATELSESERNTDSFGSTGDTSADSLLDSTAEDVASDPAADTEGVSEEAVNA